MYLCNVSTKGLNKPYRVIPQETGEGLLYAVFYWIGGVTITVSRDPHIGTDDARERNIRMTSHAHAGRPLAMY